MKNNNENVFDWKRIVLLIGLLASFVILILEGVDKVHTVHLRGIFDIVFLVLWAVLELDAVFRLMKVSKEEGFEQYRKFNVMELIYLVISPIALVCTLVNPSWAWMRWVVLFKMQSVLRKYNDEKVFQVIAKSVALILIAFFIVPVFNVLSVAISAPGQIINVMPKNIDWFSMKYALADKQFLRSFASSLFIVVVGTSIFIAITSTAAYPLSKPDLPGRKWFMLFYMITMYFTGGMATEIVLADALNLMNTIWALILPNVISVYYMFLMKNFYEGIPV